MFPIFSGYCAIDYSEGSSTPIDAFTLGAGITGQVVSYCPKLFIYIVASQTWLFYNWNTLLKLYLK